MMTMILGTERKAFARMLAEKTGFEAKYLGAPSFGYQVGPYLIKKDGTLNVDDDRKDEELLRELTVQGVIGDDWDEEITNMTISIPTNNHTALSITNLVRMMYSRQDLINKAIGRLGAFDIPSDLIDMISKNEYETLDEFLEYWRQMELNNKCTGFSIGDATIEFYGFVDTEDPDKTKAYMDLVSLMAKAALEQKRVQAERAEPSNEKYFFRVWLIRLGMNGAAYKTTRKILLEYLPGNSAFRTKEQMEIAKAKNKEARHLAKEES